MACFPSTTSTHQLSLYPNLASSPIARCCYWILAIGYLDIAEECEQSIRWFGSMPNLQQLRSEDLCIPISGGSSSVEQFPRLNLLTYTLPPIYFDSTENFAFLALTKAQEAKITRVELVLPPYEGTDSRLDGALLSFHWQHLVCLKLTFAFEHLLLQTVFTNQKMCTELELVLKHRQASDELNSVYTGLRESFAASPQFALQLKRFALTCQSDGRRLHVLGDFLTYLCDPSLFPNLGLFTFVIHLSIDLRNEDGIAMVKELEYAAKMKHALEAGRIRLEGRFWTWRGKFWDVQMPAVAGIH